MCSLSLFHVLSSFPTRKNSCLHKSNDEITFWCFSMLWSLVVSPYKLFLLLNSGTFQHNPLFLFSHWCSTIIFSSKSHLNFTSTHSLAALKLWIYRQQMTLGEKIHLIPLITVPVWLSKDQSSFHALLCLPAHHEDQLMDCRGFGSPRPRVCKIPVWSMEECPLPRDVPVVSIPHRRQKQKMERKLFRLKKRVKGGCFCPDFPPSRPRTDNAQLS